MKFLLTFVLIFSAATVIFADIKVPTPKPTPTDNSKNELQLKVSDIKEPTLVIPKEFIKNLKMDVEKSPADSSASPNSFARTSTVVSGIFLSLAFIFGGVFLFKNKSVRAAAGLIMLGILSTSATIIYANVAPPPRDVKFDDSFFTDKAKMGYRGVVGPIKVEISENSSKFILLVPRSNQNKNSREE